MWVSRWSRVHAAEQETALEFAPLQEHQAGRWCELGGELLLSATAGSSAELSGFLNSQTSKNLEQAMTFQYLM